MKFVATLATEIKVGDILNVNTGYRPLDDENCKVLKVERKKSLFGDEQIGFFIESHHGNHWYDVPLEMKYGQNVYQTKVTKVENEKNHHKIAAKKRKNPIRPADNPLSK